MEKEPKYFGCLSPVEVERPGQPMHSIYSESTRQGTMLVPCGRCDWCRQMHSNDLKDRIDREFIMQGDNTALFVTLDYDNEHLPIYRRFRYSDFSELEASGVDMSDLYSKYTEGFWYSNRDPESFGFGDSLKGVRARFTEAKQSFERAQDCYRSISRRKADKELKDEARDRMEEAEIILRDRRKVYNRAVSAFNGYREFLDKRYPCLENDAVKEYPRPINHDVEECFGHLCYADILHWFKTVRTTLQSVFDGRLVELPKEIELYFKGYTYEDIRFRYFLCGEYGPTTFRPHYHCIIWFNRTLTREQTKYISQVFSSSWTNGHVDTKECYSGGASSYLANYVTSFNHLPEVLRAKHVRPFCTFSKSPTIGVKQINREEIKRLLDSGRIDYNKWDDDTKSFVDDIPSSTFFRRYFPKCTGFNSTDRVDKLSVYSYVFDYFRRLGIEHTPEDVESIRICDIQFPTYLCTLEDLSAVRQRQIVEEERTGRPQDFDDFLSANMFKDEEGYYFKTWQYADKHASLVAYRYCVLFGYLPSDILSSFDSIYSELRLRKMGQLISASRKQAPACTISAQKDNKNI